MGSSASSNRKEVEIEYVGINGEVKCRRGTTALHPRVFAVLPWFVFLFIAAALAAHSLILSCELNKTTQRCIQIKHLRQDLQASQQQIQQLLVDVGELNRHKAKPSSAIEEDTGNLTPTNIKDAVTLFANDTVEVKARTKRRTSDRRRRSRGPKKIGPCQLHGISGPNAPRSETTPLQKPQSVERSLLWRLPDTESQTDCFMSTTRANDYDAIEYVKITIEGYYYVYSQIAYYSNGLYQSGHQVILKRGTYADLVLMESVAPPIRVSSDYSNSGGIANAKSLSETKFTAGVFRFFAGDLIGIFPRSRNDEFQMLQDRSFWGLIFLGVY